MMRLRLALLVTWLIQASMLVRAQDAGPKALIGFSPSGSTHQRLLESSFDSFLNKNNLRDWMKRLTAKPHHLGSPADKENAEWIASQFRSWGYETQIERFEVLFPTPKSRLVEMISPRHFKARLEEPALSEDSTSGHREGQLPAYNAYSIDGDVTAPLVYVNYGVPKDYETLAEKGVDVRGKIVIARYGQSWRGIKPKVAAEHGAVGCIIYSDPRDDGYFQGDVYPKGSFRSEYGAQRGSVADMPVYPGDPLTPGVGSTPSAKRLPLADAITLTKIPVLPISYADAQPMLRALDGPVAPEPWRGALPITYHIGAGPATVHLKLDFNWDIVPCYDVIARLPGAQRPDEWVIRGNHHDAWVFGADDPISGAVALMEEARAVGELAKTGWKPKRTIIYALWDGEEPGLLGSTEWVETHADELTAKAAVYVNSDNSGRGFLSVSGSHILERLVEEIAKDVIDPQTKVPVGTRARARSLADATPEARRELRQSNQLHISAMGSGSDYTPFIQHLGVPSLDIRYRGENEGGSYHSIYDSFDHYSRFGDPGFDYGITLAQTAGRAVLRIAEAETLPFEFTRFSETVARYAKEIDKLAGDMRDEAMERNRLIAEKTLALAADPTKRFVVPKPQEPVPFLNFAPLQNAVTRLMESAKRYEAARAAEASLDPGKQKDLDDLLIRIERLMTSPAGLPRRPWFKHHVYAPGFYTGYAVKTLPGVREAIEQRNWKESEEQTVLVAKTLEAVAQQIDRATALVSSTNKSAGARRGEAFARRLSAKHANVSCECFAPPSVDAEFV